MAASLAYRPQRPFLCIPPRSNIENDFIVLNQMRKMLQSTHSPERQINELTLDCWAFVEISSTYTQSIILGEENVAFLCQYLRNRGLTFLFPSMWELYFMRFPLLCIVLKQQACQEWRQCSDICRVYGGIFSMG